MNSASELSEQGSRVGVLHFRRQKQQRNKQTPNPARQPLDEQSLSLTQRHWVSYGNFLLYKLAWFLWFCWRNFVPRVLCDMSTPQTFMHVCKCGYILSFMTFRGFERKCLIIFDFLRKQTWHTQDIIIWQIFTLVSTWTFFSTHTPQKQNKISHTWDRLLSVFLWAGS